MDNPTQMAYAREVLDPELAARGLVPGVTDKEGLLFLDNRPSLQHLQGVRQEARRALLVPLPGRH
jgi:hypothetical protein